MTGGWAWNRLAPKLTGLGDRWHLSHADITHGPHVEDIVQTIEAAEARDIVLVGHSHAGFIIGTAARAAEVCASLTGGDLVPPTGLHRWSDDPATLDRPARMCRPQPIRCFSDGPTLTGRDADNTRRRYLRCARHAPSRFTAFLARQP